MAFLNDLTEKSNHDLETRSHGYHSKTNMRGNNWLLSKELFQFFSPSLWILNKLSYHGDDNEGCCLGHIHTQAIFGAQIYSNPQV